MTNNAPDYTDNLAFPPQGDWSDTQPKNNTDRTQSSCDMVDKIEKLTTENTKLKELLGECRDEITGNFDSFIEIIAGGETAELIAKIDELLGDETDTKELEK